MLQHAPRNDDDDDDDDDTVDLQSAQYPCTSHACGTVIVSKRHSQNESKGKTGERNKKTNIWSSSQCASSARS